jgi:hypothetical protein
MMMNIVIPEGIRKLIKLLPIKTIAVCAVVYFGWGIIYPSGTWRYKMTVTVETPEGIKTGSAVREVRAADGIKLTPESNVMRRVRGEAVVIDLSKRGVLFSLMSGDSGTNIFFDAFPAPGCGNGCIDKSTIVYYNSHFKVGQKVTLKANQYPMFVHFKDINDQTTVEQWCETETCALYEKIFVGHKAIDFKLLDLRIKEVTIEMTDEPVTKIIDKMMPPMDMEKFNKWYATGINGNVYQDIPHNLKTGVK